MSGRAFRKAGLHSALTELAEGFAGGHVCVQVKQDLTQLKSASDDLSIQLGVYPRLVCEMRNHGSSHV